MMPHWISADFGAVLGLLEELHEAVALVEDRLGLLVEVGAELRERREFAVLGEVDLASCRRPACMALICAADRRRGDTEMTDVRRPGGCPG
jgi:hypothetical protein